MKTERNIRVAFFLNLSFSLLELLGGLFTNSIAILSDAVHDLGDAISIGASWLCERKSHQKPNETYTYGYARYSVLGGVITIVVLLVGSLLVIFQSIERLFHPAAIDYNGMLIIAVIGVIINFVAAYFTREGDSINQKAVNLHMLEDVLGWAVVLIGAIIMRFTDFSFLDALMSLGVSLFILVSAIHHLKEVLEIFLVKVPDGIEVAQLKEQLLNLDTISDIHHMHVWSMDGQSHYATLHAVTKEPSQEVKESIREILAKNGICHVTIELETSDENCGERECRTAESATVPTGHHHHHHHHHH